MANIIILTLAIIALVLIGVAVKSAFFGQQSSDVKADAKLDANKPTTPEIRRTYVPNKAYTRNNATRKQPHSTIALGNKLTDSPEDIALQEASTVLGDTHAVEGNDIQQAETLLRSYRTLVENIRSGDIANFCKKRPILSVKRSARSKPRETILEFVDDLPCGEADIWALLCTSGNRYYILPSGVTSLRYGTLNADNSGMFKEIFQGVMIVVSNSKFELLTLGIAEKLGDKLVVKSQGRIGIPA